MKYKCFKTDSCKVCKRKGTIQAFLNSTGIVKYARTRHYSKGKFTYCKLDNLNEIQKLLLDQNRIGQKQTWSNKHPESSLKTRLVAGPLG